MSLEPNRTDDTGPARFRPSLAAALVLSLAVACGTAPEEGPPDGSGVKVLLIGIDGASNRILEPLMEQGRLPNFTRLVEDGVRGKLRSEKPMNSPPLWTTIATGFHRERHGIEGFGSRVLAREAGAAAPPIVSSLDRRLPAMWNLVDRHGGRSQVVGWWGTWPADPLDGVLVSDRFARGRFTAASGRPGHGLVHPPELQDELEALALDPLALTLDDLPPLAEWSASDRASFDAADRPDFAGTWGILRFAFSSQSSYERMALSLLETRGQPDLAAVFLIATDPVCHTFWHFHEPQAFEGVDPEDAARLGPIIPNFYVYMDEVLGRLLERVDDDTVVLIVSDHGFQASNVIPKNLTANEVDDLRRRKDETGQMAVGQSGTHHLDGLIIASGGPIRSGLTLDASIYDVTPTVLALMGLPVADEYPGRVLENWVEPSFWQEHPIRRTATFDADFQRPSLEDAGTATEDEADMLRALGYWGEDE